MRLLLLDPLGHLVQDFQSHFQERGIEVHLVRDLALAQVLLQRNQTGLALLDMQGPRDAALTLLANWPRGDSGPLVLAVTTAGQTPSVAECLELGADDCVARPVDPREVVARLQALCRRFGTRDPELLRIHDLEIDTHSRLVKRAGKLCELTPREFALLRLLVLHCGRVVPRSLIWNELYEARERGSSNVIDVYIRYLRLKIDRGRELPLILTRRGEGYLLRSEPIGPGAVA